MSRKEPIEIEIKDNFRVKPEVIFESKVVPSGNGAVIRFFKRYINKEVIVIVGNKMKKSKKDEDKEIDEFIENGSLGMNQEED